MKLLQIDIQKYFFRLTFLTFYFFTSLIIKIIKFFHKKKKKNGTFLEIFNIIFFYSYFF